MYSNSKEQISLEEAYRNVHLEKVEECDCGSGHCEDYKKEKCEDCYELECECLTEEGVDPSSVVDAAKTVINSDPDEITRHLYQFLSEVAGLATLTLYLSKDQLTRKIDGVIRSHKIQSLIKQKKELEGSHDMSDLIKGHNLSVEIARLGGYEFLEQLHGKEPASIARAIESGLDKLKSKMHKK
jgi:hypothetical protein